VEVPPVLRDQCSPSDEGGGGDEGVGRLRRVVVERKSVEKFVRQFDDRICLEDDSKAVDEREPLRAQVVVLGACEFSTDRVADGEVATADVRLERLAEVVRSYDCRRVEQNREISQRAAADCAAGFASERYSRTLLRLPSARVLISRRTRAISAIGASASTSPNARAARSADTTQRVPMVTKSTLRARRSA
jgi:hypothetical protein